MVVVDIVMVVVAKRRRRDSMLLLGLVELWCVSKRSDSRLVLVFLTMQNIFLPRSFYFFGWSFLGYGYCVFHQSVSRRRARGNNFISSGLPDCICILPLPFP